MSSLKNIAIIITSTRTPRVGPHAAAVVKEILEKELPDDKSVTLSLVDLADFKLPVYDEPVIPFNVPHSASFTHEHSRRWSAEIKKHDGYVLVIPEYNYGMTGGTKNAIDYLKHEWEGKPAVIVSYGIQGGKTASEQVKTSLEGLKLRVAKTRPQLPFAGGAGPDLFAAMGDGVLGEDTKKAWQAEAPTIAKAFGELKEVLSATTVET